MDHIKKVKLEDDINYTVVDEIDYEGTTYYYLTDETKDYNFKIRKLVSNFKDSYLVGLDSTQEFQQALRVFWKKYKNE